MSSSNDIIVEYISWYSWTELYTIYTGFIFTRSNFEGSTRPAEGSDFQSSSSLRISSTLIFQALLHCSIEGIWRISGIIPQFWTIGVQYSNPHTSLFSFTSFTCIQGSQQMSMTVFPYLLITYPSVNTCFDPHTKHSRGVSDIGFSLWSVSPLCFDFTKWIRMWDPNPSMKVLQNHFPQSLHYATLNTSWTPQCTQLWGGWSSSFSLSD